jgi:hypothetical protein
MALKIIGAQIFLGAAEKQIEIVTGLAENRQVP